MGSSEGNTIADPGHGGAKILSHQLTTTSFAPFSPLVIARLDRGIQYAAAVVMNLDASGILDAPPAAFAEASAALHRKPRRSLGLAGSRGMTAGSCLPHR